MRRRLSTIIAALLLDLLIGDPPNRWHPVAWMGTFIAYWQKRAVTEGRLAPLLNGGLIAFCGALFVSFLGSILARFPGSISWLIETAVLKSTFSLRGLVHAANDVETALQDDDISQARHWLSWHLVSRNTHELNESQIAAATIESLAENLSDSVAAPIFYYWLGGLPGALAYRYLNTCDAMLGYRDKTREWLGKIPARTDDVLNLIPARLTGVSILIANFIAHTFSNSRELKDWRQPVQVYCSDCQKTDSPNAGHPMSAMAGALGVELEKVGQYSLGKGQRPPETQDIRKATNLLYGATAVLLSVLFLTGIQSTRGKR